MLPEPKPRSRRRIDQKTPVVAPSERPDSQDDMPASVERPERKESRTAEADRRQRVTQDLKALPRRRNRRLRTVTRRPASY